MKQTPKQKTNRFPIDVDVVRKELSEWFAANPKRERARNRRELLQSLLPDLQKYAAEGRYPDEFLDALRAQGIECSASSLKAALAAKIGGK